MIRGGCYYSFFFAWMRASNLVAYHTSSNNIPHHIPQIKFSQGDPHTASANQNSPHYPIQLHTHTHYIIRPAGSVTKEVPTDSTMAISKGVIVVLVLLLLTGHAASFDFSKCATGVLDTGRMAYKTWYGSPKEKPSKMEWLFSVPYLYYCLPGGGTVENSHEGDSGGK